MQLHTPEPFPSRDKLVTAMKPPNRATAFWSNLSAMIAGTEADLFGGTPEKHLFIAAPGRGRLMRLTSSLKAWKENRHPGGANPDLKLYPESTVSYLSWLVRNLLRPFFLSTHCDLIVCRTNISFFYFEHGLRLKVPGPGSPRSAAALANEYNWRRKIETFSCLKVPRLIHAQLDRPPIFFLDEIVAGNIVTWRHPDAPVIIKSALPAMWCYYKCCGLHWLQPGQLGLDIAAILKNYRQATAQRPELQFPFHPAVIETLKSKKALCSQIHGDFAIHNIIVVENGYYITDWELSDYDLVMRDFYRSLIIKGWDLAPLLDQLVNDAISHCPGEGGRNLMTFCEQLYFILFLETAKMLDDPDYPPRLLKRAEEEMTAFFLRARESGSSIFYCFRH